MKNFLDNWDKNYRESLKQIALFDTNQTSQWNLEQKQLFIKLLYHQRGHFDDILWFMGNFAPDQKSKEMILENIREEFGGHAASHEKLYLDFAKSHGVDLSHEMLDEEMYLLFLKKFNYELLAWFKNYEWNHNIAAFAAVERLDNLDYPALKNVAISMKTPHTAMVFFNVHIHANHFENIENSTCLSDLWTNHPHVIIKNFDFIANHYLGIWREISNYVFTCRAEAVVETN